MTEHKIVTRDEWTIARNELLALEKEHTRRSDELAQLRQQLPWARREGVHAPDSSGSSYAHRAVRRAIAACDLQLHVRAGLRRRLPGVLLDR